MTTYLSGDLADSRSELRPRMSGAAAKESYRSAGVVVIAAILVTIAVFVETR
jgi:hypothetical protein